jgi:hypothetical protein
MPPSYPKQLCANFSPDDYNPLVQSDDLVAFVVVDRTETMERRKRPVMYRTHS